MCADPSVSLTTLWKYDFEVGNGREMGSRLHHELDVQFVTGETLIGERGLHYF